MSRIKKHILKNYNLSLDEMSYVDSIVAEIEAELDAGEYDCSGTGMISDSTLAEVWDEKLAQRLEA